MQLSNKPTDHILIKARTNSEWDNCGFAVITLSENWKKWQRERLDATKALTGDHDFLSVCFYEDSVDFYQIPEDDVSNADELLAGKDWVFIEVSDEELENLTPPENSLDCYRLFIYRDGNAKYTAYGRHTSEEFWTEKFSLQEILKK